MALALRAGWLVSRAGNHHGPKPDHAGGGGDRCTKTHEQIFLLSVGPIDPGHAEAIAKARRDSRLDMGKMNRIGRLNEAGSRGSGSLVPKAATQSATSAASGP